jgi:hypothetical protein
MVTPQPLKIAQENIASIQHRLRGEMLDEILAALEFPALDSKAFCRIDELAYRKGGSSRHGRA